MPFVAGNQQPIQYPPQQPPNTPFVGPVQNAVGPWNPNGPGYPGTPPPPFVGPLPNQVGPYNPAGPGYQPSQPGRGGAPFMGPIQNPYGGRGGDRQGFMDRSRMHSYGGPMGIDNFERGPRQMGPQGPMGIMQNGGFGSPWAPPVPRQMPSSPGGGGPWWRPTDNTSNPAWSQGQPAPQGPMGLGESSTMEYRNHAMPPQQMYNRPAYGGPSNGDYLK